MAAFIGGAILKTKADSTNTPNGAFKVFASANGKAIGTLKPSSYVGSFVQSVGEWTQIRLRNPISGNQYGWILSDKLVQWQAPYNYYIQNGRTGVNVRNAPSLTSGVLKKLNGGMLAGKSDGYNENGFVFLALNGGGYGWISADYITRSNVTAQPTTTGTETRPPDLSAPTETKDYRQFLLPGIIFLSCITLLMLVRYAIKFQE
ncbi:uncharacterized protein YgiM (DUF1202 family) [Runella defluvii]|uniref:Uncharacterized protein YgiM (DUF1202 family) n=1 Tax=Runella defluvii TaxID=370973 RepID=A0A7W5ZPP9_9BACT|nr:SH3 domain-containing protein [Runella defluvii]MBB3840758.1 uncharacterized protein YgiM (DUF1202 family) [Runella defluvii]